jgi:D-amino-acid dehydrogenase
MRVVVVGAGITGASAADAIRRRGAESLLVDARVPGQATAAGAGIVCPWSSRVSDPAWIALADAAAARYPDLVAELTEAGRPDPGYRRVGALRLASDDADLAATREQIAERAAGSPVAGAVEVVDGQELFPPLRPGQAAVHVAGGARVDGRAMRDALQYHVPRRTGPAQLLVEHDTVVGVSIFGKRIEADAVVAAPGAWAPELLRPVGVEVAVTPHRGQIVHLGLPGTDTAAWPVVLPPSSHYMLAFDDSRVVVGATREAGAGFDHRVTAGGLAEVLTEALAVAPGLAGATHLETRIGFRPAGPDLLPLLGPVPGLAGLVLATGLGASGLMFGPLVGEIAADLALGVDPGLDLTPFDPLRS